MSDLISMLGYSKGSPFFNNPYLDIHSPSGSIDMSNTPIDLFGVDEYGNKQKMKANRKTPYTFQGSKIREIPLSASYDGDELSLNYKTKKGLGLGVDYSKGHVNAKVNLPFTYGGRKQRGGLTAEQFRPAYMQYSDSLETGVHPNALKTGPNSFYQLTPEDKAKLEKRYNDRTSNSFFVSFFNSLAAAVSNPGDLMYGLKTAGSPHYIPKKQRGGKTERLVGNAAPNPGTPYFNKLKQAWTDNYNKAQQAESNQYYYTDKDYSDSVSLTQGKYNTGRIPKTMVTRAVQAARKENVNPYDLLALAGQESTFGTGYAKDNKVGEQKVISGWNLGTQPQQYGMFLANRKVPGVTAKRTSKGYVTDIDDTTVEGYLSKHPEIIDQYQTALSHNDYSQNSNFFDLAAQKIKKEGFKTYNPGDPNYESDISASRALLMKEQGLTDYIKTIKQKGGYTMDDLHDFLFEDDQEQGQQEDYPTPSIEETNENIQSQYNQLQDDQDESLALQIAMGDDDQTDWGGNPYMGGGRGAGNNSGFRSFSSYQEGRKALENQLELYKTGKTKNKVGPRSTLLEAMSVYAPSSDNNNPTAYANFIANKIGVSPNTPISRLDTRKWADAIEIMEGNKKGNNPGNLR